jgi:hypothetical protein
MLFDTGRAKQLYTAVQMSDADALDEHPSWAERIIVAVAIALAVVIITAVTIMMGIA